MGQLSHLEVSVLVIAHKVAFEFFRKCQRDHVIAVGHSFLLDCLVDEF